MKKVLCILAAILVAAVAVTFICMKAIQLEDNTWENFPEDE